jgi:pimeloyl-ACP methyl ester carboxylesterase
VKLIILPGVNSGAYLFEGARELKDVEVVRLDPPGVGKMLPLTLPFTPKAYAREVLRYMDLHNIWQADILGHSMGGFAAQELVQMSPDRVNRLILVSTSAGQPGTTRDVAAMPGKIKMGFWEFNQLIEHEPLEGMKVLFGKRFVTHHPHLYGEFIKQRTAHLPAGSVSLAHLTAGGAFSSQRWIRKLNVPALVIHGSDDVLVSAQSGRELAGYLPDARYIELHGVGHFPMLEHEKFWSYVKGFLAGDGAGLRVEASQPTGMWSRLKEILTRHG